VKFIYASLFSDYARSKPCEESAGLMIWAYSEHTRKKVLKILQLGVRGEIRPKGSKNVYYF